MQRFRVTVRTAGQVLRYFAIATSAASALEAAAIAQGEHICGITVVPL